MLVRVSVNKGPVIWPDVHKGRRGQTYFDFDFDASVWISVKFRMFRKTTHVHSALISINTFRMGSSHFCISLYSGDDKFLFVALRFV